MRRVLVLGASGGGMARFRRHLLADIARSGAEVFAVADYESERDRALVARHDAVPIHLPLRRAGVNPLGELLCLVRIARLLARLRPDTVLLYTIKPVIYGGLACRALRIRRRYAMITGAGAMFTPRADGTRLRGLVERLYRHAMHGMPRVFFQNEDDMRLFVGRGMTTCEQARVVPGSGIDLDEFSFRAMRGSEQGVRFLFLGRYLADKGFVDFLRAARAVRARAGEKARFLVAGRFDPRSGPEERDALDAAVTDGVVHDLGFVEDVPALLADIDVLVLPSYGEGVPHSVLEAMAVGRAVVTTDAPGCRDTVRDGDNGRLVPTGDVERLADVLAELAAAPQRLPAMGRASRALAERRFGVARVNRIMLANMGMLPGNGIADGAAIASRRG